MLSESTYNKKFCCSLQNEKKVDWLSAKREFLCVCLEIKRPLERGLLRHHSEVRLGFLTVHFYGWWGLQTLLSVVEQRQMLENSIASPLWLRCVCCGEKSPQGHGRPPPHSHPCQFIFYLHHQGRWFDKLPLACLRLQDTKQHHVWLVSEFNGLERSVLYQLLLRRNPCLFDNGCSGAKKTEAYCSMQEVRANTAWPYPEVHINVRHVGHAMSQ